MSKIYFHNTVVELCTSIQEGLPLIPTKFMEVIIEGVLAAGCSHYPVTICAYTFLRNHFHMILIIQDPADFPCFVGYIKTELAHAVNRLLGRTKRSVWEEDFDSPVILTHDKVIDRLKYLYLNPVEANLASSILNYRGANTFSYAQAETSTRTFLKFTKKIPRNAIPTLPKHVLSPKEQEKLANQLEDNAKKTYELSISPWAWLQCFEATKRKDPKEYQEWFLREFFHAEKRVAAQHKFPPPPPSKQCLADIRQKYESKRAGRKMRCLASSYDLVKRFVDWFHQQRKIAKAVMQRWMLGDFTVNPPPGFYAPGRALPVCALFPQL